jgi:arylsulfatase A-like enzyme
MGCPSPTTPFLDSLAKESLVFPTAIVSGAPTYYSFPAILASRYPLGLGRDVLGIAPREPTLASVLRSQGYATAGLIAANPYISAQFGYEQGFDVFKDFMKGELSPRTDGAALVVSRGWLSRLNLTLERKARSLGPLGAVYDELYFQYCQRWGAPRPKSLDELRRFPAADVLVKEAINWLTTLGGERFFLWIHFMDPHSPYYPTEEALGMLGISGVTPFRARYLNSAWNRGDLTTTRLQRHRQNIVQLYDAGVRWVDTQLARIAGYLRQTGLWEKCVFTVTADHGEELLDHGGRYHPPGRLTEELIRVPLLLRVPGMQAKRVADAPFSLLHLAPTLLNALSVPAPASFQGCNYWEQIQRGETWDDPAVVECVEGCTNPFCVWNRVGSRSLAIRDARFKLVLRFDPPAEDLYDLTKDPKEMRPLSPSAEKATRRALLDRARQHLRRSVEDRDPELRLRSQLRDLRLEWSQAV